MPGHRTNWRIATLVFVWAGASSCKSEPEPLTVAIAAPHSTRITEVETPAAIQRLETDDGQIAAGRQIAVRDCSSCHALDADSTSPRPSAPPLKKALWRYNEDALATHLIEAIRVGHGDMPVFDFSVIGADALIAYLRSIRSPQDERDE
jgi:cytochrome c